MTTEHKRMQQIRGTTAEWTANDITPFDGEIAVERAVDGPRLKLGDGVSPYSGLPYLAGNKANASAIGITPVDEDLGAFTDSVLPDDATVKEAIQALGTEADRPYQPPATPFYWWVGSDDALAQVFSETDMPDSGATPTFGHVRQWNVKFGNASTPYQVGRAELMVGSGAGGNFYTWNPLAHVDATWPGDSFTPLEVNANNISGRNFGDNSGDFDVANSAVDWATVANLIGVGQRFTAALAIGAPTAAGQCFNRSITMGDAAKLTHIQCGVSAAASVIKATGSSSSGLIDLSGVTANHAMFVHNASALSTTNGAGTVIIKMAYVNAGNTLILGEGAASGVALMGDTLPGSDNAYNLAHPSFRFKNLYVVNAPVVGSDPALKTDIAPPAEADIATVFAAINPITYRWKIERVEEYEEEVDGIVPLKRNSTRDQPVYEFRDGGAVQTGVETIEEDDPVFEDVPVVDPETGEPMTWQVIDHKSGKPMVDPETGQPIPPQPRMVSRPVMVPGKVIVRKTREIPGERVHIGFNALEIETALGGLDWGLVERSDDAPLGLRESRMTAVLWAYVKQLEARVAALEAIASVS